MVKLTGEFDKNHVSRVDVVWAEPKHNSGKLARLTRGKGARPRVELATKKSDWQKFLNMKENLGELQDILIEHVKN